MEEENLKNDLRSVRRYQERKKREIFDKLQYFRKEELKEIKVVGRREFDKIYGGPKYLFNNVRKVKRKNTYGQRLEKGYWAHGQEHDITHKRERRRSKEQLKKYRSF